jgi:hypothetical protein
MPPIVLLLLLVPPLLGALMIQLVSPSRPSLVRLLAALAAARQLLLGLVCWRMPPADLHLLWLPRLGLSFDLALDGLSLPLLLSALQWPGRLDRGGRCHQRRPWSPQCHPPGRHPPFDGLQLPRAHGPAGARRCAATPLGLQRVPRPSILRYHLLAGAHRREELIVHAEWESLEGAPVPIRRADPFEVRNATVLQADIACDNGIVHVLNRVILPG